MAKAPVKRLIRCYLCGHRFEVSARAMSIPCPKCNKGLKIEDVIIKTYLPVNDVQTCGKITITKNGRVTAKRIMCGTGIECEGIIEGSIQSDGVITLGPKAKWKGPLLQGVSLRIEDGATLNGRVKIPWRSEDIEKEEAKRARPSKPSSHQRGAAESAELKPEKLDGEAEESTLFEGEEAKAQA